MINKKDSLLFGIEKYGKTMLLEYFVKYSPHKIIINQNKWITLINKITNQ